MPHRKRVDAHSVAMIQVRYARRGGTPMFDRRHRVSLRALLVCLVALPPTATLSPNAVAHPTSPVTPPASGELMGHSPLLAGSVGSARPRTQRVSVASGGRQADNESFDPALSANGRYVAFSSEATNLVAG